MVQSVSPRSMFPTISNAGLGSQSCRQRQKAFLLIFKCWDFSTDFKCRRIQPLTWICRLLLLIVANNLVLVDHLHVLVFYTITVRGQREENTTDAFRRTWPWGTPTDDRAGLTAQAEDTMVKRGQSQGDETGVTAVKQVLRRMMDGWRTPEDSLQYKYRPLGGANTL